MSDRIKEFYEDAIRLWGSDSQMQMCIEEMSELTKEICKYKRYTKLVGQATPEKLDEVRKNIIEETADVLNCVNQLARMFGEDEVYKIQKDKVERTLPKLNEFRKLSNIKRTTLLYIIKDGKVLLGKKLRGFGKGKYNGCGGKVLDGETIEEGMLRETKEEFSVVPKNYKQVGNILYDAYNGEDKIIYDTAIFLATDFEGTPQTTDEMMPIWFDKDKLPFDEMFEDDVFWVQKVLDGKHINARFEFDKNLKIISKELYFH